MFKTLPFLLSLLFVTSCGGIIDKYFIPVADDTVQEIFEAGNDAMEEKRYREAAKYFLDIKDNYPFSTYVVEAELSLGDAYYLNGLFLEAADAYRDFEELHPRHEAIPYVLLQVAKSTRQSYKSIDKATTELEIGLEYAERVINEYPSTDYAAAAQNEKMMIRQKIAERDVYIAQVYNKMGNYEAAWNRYTKISQNYPDLPEIQSYAEEQGNANFLLYREKDSETVREDRVGSWKNWFKWL